jgi:hypothetical protein
MQVKTLRASRQDVLGGRHGSTLDVQFFERFEEVGQLATFGIIACELCENAGGSPQWSDSLSLSPSDSAETPGGVSPRWSDSLSLFAVGL